MMPKSRTTASRQANLRSSVRGESGRRQRVHDFNNLVTELVFAVQVEEGEYVKQLVGQVRDMYASAVER